MTLTESIISLSNSTILSSTSSTTSSSSTSSSSSSSSSLSKMHHIYLCNSFETLKLRTLNHELKEKVPILHHLLNDQQYQEMPLPDFEISGVFNDTSFHWKNP